MTNEELIEELLTFAHELGIRKKDLDTTLKLMYVDKTLHFYDAINKAFNIEKNKLDDDRR
ncbi:MAG: hypothetical protein ACK5P0_01440 [bacterium]